MTGGTQIKELIEVARQNDFTDVVVVHEHRGEPDSLVVCHMPYGPTVSETKTAFTCELIQSLPAHPV